MKINVLTVDDVTIKKFHWWSNWIDICVFNWSGEAYLLQMKISRRNNKKFKHIPMHSKFSVVHPRSDDIGDLIQMKGISI